MNFRITALLLAALAVPALKAQDVRFGVQGTLALPQSDLKDAVDSKMGYGLGAHLAVDMGKGHMLRPRIDYTWFPEQSQGDATLGGSIKVNKLSAGLDYLYFVDGKPQGLYFTGGLALNRWKVDVHDYVHMPGFPAFDYSSSEESNKLGVAAGLGYQFNRTFGAELRYEKSAAYNGGDFDSIQATFTFKF